MTLQQDFANAKALNSADELLFLPLIEKFEELKKVIESNFLMKQRESKWYGKTTWVVKPALNVEIENKIDHSTGKYLFITINGRGYVMGLGQLGELKDRVYFCTGNFSSNSTNKTIVHITNTMYNTIDYCLENHLTTVQLFSYLIKEYKNYLVNKNA